MVCHAKFYPVAKAERNLAKKTRFYRICNVFFRLLIPPQFRDQGQIWQKRVEHGILYYAKFLLNRYALSPPHSKNPPKKLIMFLSECLMFTCRYPEWDLLWTVNTNPLLHDWLEVSSISKIIYTVRATAILQSAVKTVISPHRRKWIRRYRCVYSTNLTCRLAESIHIRRRLSAHLNFWVAG